MPAIRRILVAVKALNAKSLPAVLKAAQIAHACGAELELYYGLDTPMYADLSSLGNRGIPELQLSMQQRALHGLENIADRLRRHSLKVKVSAEWDFPAYEAIVRRALHIQADLIVSAAHAGRHHLPSLMRLTDWELVRLSPVPVLIVKNSHPYRHPAILTALDPTHAFSKPIALDKRVLDLGQTLAKAMKGTLHAVHAYARVPAGSLRGAGLTPMLLEKIAQRAERAAKASLDRALRSTRVARTRRYLVARDPVSGIAEATVKSHAALLVMGAISRSGFKRLLIGNTAERILDDVSCDVLVVKPRQFQNRVSRTVRGVHRVSSPGAETWGYY